MSFFSSILDKLGFGAASAAPEPAAAPTAAATVSAPDAAASDDAASDYPQTVVMSRVDVVAKLDGLAASNAQKLNWKVSIVDLLKLLDLDSSFKVRKELAVELGCPEEKMNDSAQMNMWLHKTVLQKIADNGGNIPAELLD